MQQGPHARRAQFGSRSGSMCITIAATSLQSFVLGTVLPATVAEFENFFEPTERVLIKSLNRSHHGNPSERVDGAPSRDASCLPHSERWR